MSRESFLLFWPRTANKMLTICDDSASVLSLPVASVWLLLNPARSVAVTVNNADPGAHDLLDSPRRE